MKLDFEAVVLDYIMEARQRMERMEVDLREHKEGVIQNRTRIQALEEKEEKIEREVEELKEPSDTQVTLATLKKWGQWILVVSAAGKFLYDIFN